MSRLSSEIRFGSLNSYVFGSDPYDSSKLGLGPLLKQFNGVNSEDKWAGPLPVGIIRPMETAGGIPAMYPYVFQWSSDIDWIFCSDGATAAATRRVQMFTYTRSTGAFAWLGAITCFFPYAGTQGTYTVTGFRMVYDTYTTGSASASDFTVTGSETLWQTSRIAAGGRIGFGTTDPNLVTTWYNILSINGEGSITVDSNVGTVTSGEYVIEELRAVMCMTCTTATNGGLFLVKGLNPSCFSSGAQAIPAAITTDNVRAVYWLKDAATNTNTVSFGCPYLPRESWDTHYAFVLNTIANPIVYKYNIRAALTVSSGASTSAFVLVSGSGGVLTGAAANTNNGRMASVFHGGGNGIPCIYFVTVSRLYRTVDVRTIASGSTNWLSDGAVEIPPGSVTTYAATSTMRSIEYSNTLDMFVIPTVAKVYLTKYMSDGSQFNRIFLSNTYQLNPSTTDSSAPVFPTAAIGPFNVDTVSGILYLVSTGTTAATNFMFSIPISCDWEYAVNTNNRLIFPEMSTLGCSSFGKVYVNSVQVIGGKSDKNLGTMTEPFRVYYRTSGISDNSGTWNLLDSTGDISSIAPASSIQIMVEFRILGQLGVPARILGASVTYEDSSTDSHYQPSVANSSISNKYFAWRFASAFNSTVPRLRIRLYNAVTGEGPLVDDDSVSQIGTWEKSIDGGISWGSYDSSDKSNEITYIRFKPLSLGDNIRVKALLSLYS